MHRLLFFFSSIIIVISCTSTKTTINNYNTTTGNVAPNYADLFFWAAHPQKKSTADSLPKAYEKNFIKDTSVDIFFIHPTTYTSKDKEMGWNASVTNPTLNEKTNNTAILYQASAFNKTGNIYAPYYRQANYYAYLPITHQDTVEAWQAFTLAYKDVANAFKYYLQHYNNGKPFIIAAHSQGTNHATTLIKEFIDGKPLQQQLIAAYLVGMPIKENEFKNIKPCTKPNQTNCFCSWRTMKKNYIVPYIQKETFKAVVTNPLSWQINDSIVLRKNNKGSILKNFKKIVPHVADAIVHQNVLWTRHPKFFGSFLIRLKNYHIADYNFYYESIRENTFLRAQTFKKQTTQ
jgi:hypothetical protein